MTPVQVAREEWRVLRGNSGLWASLFLFALLAGYGLYNGVTPARRLETGARRAAVYNREQIEKTRATFTRLTVRSGTPGAPGGGALSWHAGIIAYELMPQAALEPTPLTALAVGQSDLYPGTLLMRTRLDAVRGNDEIENPVHLLTGSFDLAFVIVYALPLLVLGLGYNALSGEKEGGTLALSLAQGVSLQSLVLGKLLLRLALVLAVVWGIPTLGLLAMGSKLAIPDAFGRLLLFYGITGAYTLFWFSAALLAGSFTRSSATSAMTLLGLWLALVLVMPSLLGTVVAALHPTPSRLELAQAVRTASDRADAEGAALLQRHYQSHPDLVPPGRTQDLEDFWVRRYAAEGEVERSVAPLLDRFEERRREQKTLAAQAALLSPALLTQMALAEVAGTSESRFVRFQEQVSRFREEWQRYFLPRIYRRESVPEGQWSQLPQLSTPDEPFGTLSRRVLSLTGSAIILALLLGVAGLRALRRYPAAG